MILLIVKTNFAGYAVVRNVQSQTPALSCLNLV